MSEGWLVGCIGWTQANICALWRPVLQHTSCQLEFRVICSVCGGIARGERGPWLCDWTQKREAAMSAVLTIVRDRVVAWPADKRVKGSKILAKRSTMKKGKK